MIWRSENFLPYRDSNSRSPWSSSRYARYRVYFPLQFLTFSERLHDNIYRGGEGGGRPDRQLSLMAQILFLAVAELLLGQVMPMGSPRVLLEHEPDHSPTWVLRFRHIYSHSLVCCTQLWLLNTHYMNI
jgi:hypothetical protein